jgi:hypothetical protein
MTESGKIQRFGVGEGKGMNSKFKIRNSKGLPIRGSHS